MERSQRALKYLIAPLAAALFAASSYAAIPLSERAVLIDLYNGTNGGSWTTRTNWLGPIGSECTWYGIVCDANREHVIEIDLASNNLLGILPGTLNQLTSLQRVYLYSNQLSGSIPSLAGMDRLQIVNVNENRLTGAIPPLAGLTSLRDLQVAENRLTGPIPDLTSLTLLQSFNAYGNQLTGSIPSLQGLTQLQRFDVSLNQLSGSVPSLTGLTSLREFFFANNQLSGVIPALTGLVNLQFVDVRNNRLSGAIPSLAGLNELRSLRVQNNQLTGPIPAVPSPINSLIDGESILCPNPLTISADPAWDAATQGPLWSSACTSAAPSDGVAVPAVSTWQRLLTLAMLLVLIGATAIRTANRRTKS